MDALILVMAKLNYYGYCLNEFRAFEIAYLSCLLIYYSLILLINKKCLVFGYIKIKSVYLFKKN